MKKRMKIIGAALLLLVMIACLSACANWKTPYELLEKDGVYRDLYETQFRQILELEEDKNEEKDEK